MSAQISRREGFKRGCDPYGVECGRGVDVAPGSGDPGLWDGYAPHTSIMRILRMRENTIHTCENTNESAELRFAAPRWGAEGN